MHLAAAEEVVHPVQRIGAFGDRCLDPAPDAASRLCLGDLQRIDHLLFVGESQRLVRWSRSSAGSFANTSAPAARQVPPLSSPLR